MPTVPPPPQEPLADAALTLGPEPFSAVHYHLGMLLGERDLQVEQAYHRGRASLHHAWLHGPGVLWGFPITISNDQLIVGPGLAIDHAGRELHLAQAHSAGLDTWLRERQAQPESRTGEHAFLQRMQQGEPVSLRVLARHRACLSRPVPALAGQDGAEAGATAPSRVHDAVELTLVPVLSNDDTAPPTPLAGYPRLRRALGLDSDSPDDDEARRFRKDAPGLTPSERLRRLQPLIARDSAERLPTAGAFPASDGITLGVVRGLTWQSSAEHSAAPVIDYAARPVQLPTELLQLVLARIVL